MFAFTSLGDKIDTGIHKGPRPYVFKINGQVHHRNGSLLPENGESPVFAQLYIFYTDNEVQNRVQFLLGIGIAMMTMEMIKKLLRG
jgi:hypothetical protein